jgi:hypothetical protein
VLQRPRDCHLHSSIMIIMVSSNHRDEAVLQRPRDRHLHVSMASRQEGCLVHKRQRRRSWGSHDDGEAASVLETPPRRARKARDDDVVTGDSTLLRHATRVVPRVTSCGTPS